MTFKLTKGALILGFLAGFIWNLLGEISTTLIMRFPSVGQIIWQNGWVENLVDLTKVLLIPLYIFIVIKIYGRLYSHVELPPQDQYTPWLVIIVAAIPGLYLGAVISHYILLI